MGLLYGGQDYLENFHYVTFDYTSLEMDFKNIDDNINYLNLKHSSRKKKKKDMQIKYWKNLQSPIDGMQKISSITWSPNSLRMAVATADRVVHLFDENGQR